MLLSLVANAAAAILDIILKNKAKNPDNALQVGPTIGKLIKIVSVAAGETPAETAERLADHDALVKLYAAGPPPGANLA